MINTLLLSLVVSQAPPAPVLRAVPGSPVDIYATAAADACSLPAKFAKRVRYFSYPAYDDDPKEHLKKSVARKQFDDAWRNFLSRESELKGAKVISPYVVRIMLDDYQWEPELWETLVEIEPWYHVRVLTGKKEDLPDRTPPAVKPPDDVRKKLGLLPRRRVLYQATGQYGWQVHYNGEWTAEEEVQRTLLAEQKARKEDKKEEIKPAAPLKKVQTQVFTADWVLEKHAKELYQATGSNVPVVRADWWFYQTGQAQKRLVGYYDWLYLGQDQKDFDDLAGANINLSRERRKVYRGVIGRSSVAYNNRGMEGGATINEGVRFLTEDYQTSVNEKNSFRLLQGDAEPDGGEGLANLANGLIFMWVQNGKKKRLDAVPPDIAGDRTSGNPDFQVHAGSCMRCHAEGYKPINDLVRRTYTAPFRLDSPDYKLERQLRSAYLSEMQKFLDKGNRTYSQALEKFGFTTATFSKAWATEWSAYADADVDLEQYGRWIGVKAAVLEKKIMAEAERLAPLDRKVDPVFAALVQGIPVRIEWVEETIPELYRIASIP